MWKTISFHWKPLNWNVGKILPSNRICTKLHPTPPQDLSYSAGPRHCGDSHFPTGWPVNQHHFCKSPLLIFHRSDGLTHFVKYWVEWPVSQVSFNLLFPEASNLSHICSCPPFPLKCTTELCTLHVFRGYLFGACIMTLWKVVWQWLQAQALESGCTASY